MYERRIDVRTDPTACEASPGRWASTPVRRESLQVYLGSFEFLAYAPLAMFFMHDLRMPVEIVPELDQLGKKSVDVVFDG